MICTFGNLGTGKAFERKARAQAWKTLARIYELILLTALQIYTCTEFNGKLGFMR